MRRAAPAWFWLSILTVFLWGAWGVQSKIIVGRISPWMNQVLFPIGLLPVALLMLFSKRHHKTGGAGRGVSYALITGVLGGTGNIAFYLALAFGGTTSIVVTLAGLAPLITVVLAGVVLKESLTCAQKAGVAFALVSIFLLSL